MTRSDLAVAVRRSRADLRLAGLVAVWIVAVLLLDARADLWQQRALGAGTWLLLIAVLRGQDRRTRAQVAVVVAFATAVEYTFAPLLGVYTYRLHNVPAFVPPGHGLVYLAALAMGRSALFVVARRPVVIGTLAVGGAWSAYGLLLAGRQDALGAIWFCCLVAFLLRGRAPLVYSGAFLITTYLELLGTSMGTWAWSTHD